MRVVQLVVKNCPYRLSASPLTMTKFRALFSFRKKEIALFFMHARVAGRIDGIKMLVERNPGPEQTTCEHSKFLIIIPRKVGKACVRNRLRRQLQALIYEGNFTNIPLRFTLLCYPQALNNSLETIKIFLKITLERFTPLK